MDLLHVYLRRLEGALLAMAILVMAVSTIANVFARNVTGDSLAVTEELNRFLIVWVCFVGLGYAAGEGRHIRMSAVSDALPHRLRRGLLCFVCAVTSVLMFVLAWYAAGYVMNVVVRRSPVLDIPLTYVYMIAPFGLLVAGVHYALAALRNVVGPDAYIAFDKPDVHEEIDLGPDSPTPDGED